MDLQPSKLGVVVVAKIKHLNSCKAHQQGRHITMVTTQSNFHLKSDHSCHSVSGRDTRGEVSQLLSYVQYYSGCVYHQASLEFQLRTELHVA